MRPEAQLSLLAPFLGLFLEVVAFFLSARRAGQVYHTLWNSVELCVLVVSAQCAPSVGEAFASFCWCGRRPQASRACCACQTRDLCKHPSLGSSYEGSCDRGVRLAFRDLSMWSCDALLPRLDPDGFLFVPSSRVHRAVCRSIVNRHFSCSGSSHCVGVMEVPANVPRCATQDRPLACSPCATLISARRTRCPLSSAGFSFRSLKGS